ncbi:hypothetical protein MJO29_009297, partial [Puccinia striiformis f. sp. tritici]
PEPAYYETIQSPTVQIEPVSYNNNQYNIRKSGQSDPALDLSPATQQTALCQPILISYLPVTITYLPVPIPHCPAPYPYQHIPILYQRHFQTPYHQQTAQLHEHDRSQSPNPPHIAPVQYHYPSNFQPISSFPKTTLVMPNKQIFLTTITTTTFNISQKISMITINKTVTTATAMNTTTTLMISILTALVPMIVLNINMPATIAIIETEMILFMMKVGVTTLMMIVIIPIVLFLNTFL